LDNSDEQINHQFDNSDERIKTKLPPGNDRAVCHSYKVELRLYYSRAAKCTVYFGSNISRLNPKGPRKVKAEGKFDAQIR
jgi:hypothetical protein